MKSISKKTVFTVNSILILLLLLCTGCVTSDGKHGKTVKKGFVHTVKWKGETLSIIAKWYTDKLSNWKALAESNPGINPDRMRVGNRIIIPDRLIKTRKPMPKGYVARFAPKPSAGSEKKSQKEELEKVKAQPASGQQAVPESEPEDRDDELELFGPR